MALIWTIIIMTALMMFLSLAVDLGRVQVVKTELQRAADAAARYGASGLPDVNAAQTRATAAANDNTADGSAVVLNSATDIDFVNWNSSTQTYTVLSGAARAGANAIRVTARRTAASGNPVPLLFAKVLGISGCDVTATSIAVLTKPAAFTGTSGISMDSFNFFASYQSSVNPVPSIFSYNSNGTLASNGFIGTASGMSNTLKGSLVEGSAGDSGITYTGSKTTGTFVNSIILPGFTVQATNPGNVPVALNLSSSANWPGGTYYFTSFQMQSNVQIFFTGAATIQLDGNGTLGDNNLIVPYGYLPSNLVFKMSSGHTFTAHNGMIMGAVFQAPGGTFTCNDFCAVGGSIFAKQINLHDYCTFFADEDLSTQSTSVTMGK